MKTVKIPVKDMSVGELIDSVMAGGEYYYSEESTLAWDMVHGLIVKSKLNTSRYYGLFYNTLQEKLEEGKIYQLKTSEDYVAELLYKLMRSTKPYGISEGSRMIVKFLESEGFLTLPEGEV